MQMSLASELLFIFEEMESKPDLVCVAERIEAECPNVFLEFVD